MRAGRPGRAPKRKTAESAQVADGSGANAAPGIWRHVHSGAYVAMVASNPQM